MIILKRTLSTILRYLLIVLPVFGMLSVAKTYAQQATIWQIGDNDNGAADMALYPASFDKFLEHDFGYEDRYFLVGSSDPRTTFPFVLPGPKNAWGGTGNTAGIRSHFITLSFELHNVPVHRDAAAKSHPNPRQVASGTNSNLSDSLWSLSLDLLGVDPQYGSTLKLLINDNPYTFTFDRGPGKADTVGPFSKDSEQMINLALPNDLIRDGYNEIVITSLDGEWVAFDQIKLSGPKKTTLKPASDALIRSVRPANFQTADNKQPLLINIVDAWEKPTISVRLDGKEIMRQQLEGGSSVLEAPMPAVATKKHSVYKILINGKEYSSGTIVRQPQNEGSYADYVNTMIGAAHSRWMLAPGPWMP